jgi:hypothetical protein
VVTGLNAEDFTITESKKPQRIFSFEAPGTHVADASAAEASDDGIKRASANATTKYGVFLRSG